MSRGYAKGRPSPSQSATWYDEWTERTGGDGETWHVKRDSRGTKRWTKGKAPEWTHELRLDEGETLSSATDKLIKDDTSGDEMEEKPTHEGLDSLFDTGRTEEDPMPVEEPPVEVERDTIMSKLKGSVNVPEEFKFADNMTFYTMLRNIFRGKNILIT